MPQTHQREALLRATRLLAELARQAPASERQPYNIAAILCAHATAECILNDWAQRRDPHTGRRIADEAWPFVRVVEELLPKVAAALPPDIVVIANVKNALCQPDAAGFAEAYLADWLGDDGGQRALALIMTLESQFFPGGEPARAG